MLEVHIEKSEINTEALDEELRAALNDIIIGVGSANGKVTVYLSDAATEVEKEQSRKLVLVHDPTQLTSAQQVRIQRRQELEALRQANAIQLDLSSYIKEDEPIRQLAQKIAWLEMEFRMSKGE